jgi:hypothetical protein
MNVVRVACHVHSNWSYDGSWQLVKLARVFSKRGYQVVLITEHDRGFDESKRLEHRTACQQASSDKILLVPGIEYSDPFNVVHLLVWGDVPFVGSGVESEKVLTAAQECGGITVLAHPTRKEAWKQFRPSWNNKILGIEFWNRKTDGWAPSKHAWPLLAMSDSVPFAGLDFHGHRQFFPMVTRLELPGPINEKEVLTAFRLRRCWSRVFNLDAAALRDGIQAEAFHRTELLRRGVARLYRRTVSGL